MPYNNNRYLSFLQVCTKYKGTFTKALGKWNLDLNAAYTSPTYSTNFFGLGNETVNNQEEIGMDYNRVRLESYSIGPSIFKIMNKFIFWKSVSGKGNNICMY